MGCSESRPGPVQWEAHRGPAPIHVLADIKGKLRGAGGGERRGAGPVDAALRAHAAMVAAGAAAPAQAPAATTPAFLPKIGGMADEAILEHWSRAHRAMPEYRAAAAAVCVPGEWMRSTMLLRHAREVSETCGPELEAIKRGGDKVFETTLLGLIAQAYNLGGDVGRARGQKDMVSGHNILGKVTGVYKGLEPWKKPLFVLALQIISNLAEDRGAVSAKLAEIVDRSLHCRHVQVTSFSLVLSYSAHLVQLEKKGRGGSTGGDSTGSLSPLSSQDAAFPAACRPPSPPPSSPPTEPESAGEPGEVGAGPGTAAYQAALRKFYECFESFLDDHKENALNASFVEPTRFYWAKTSGRWECPGFLADNVETHAVNWYIALLNSALGVHVPRLATYWDDFPPPVVDFWAGLSDKAWEAFRDPEHFGSNWRGIPKLSRGGGELFTNRKLMGGYLPHNPPKERNHKSSCLGAAMNNDIKPASRFANEAVNPSAPAQQRKCFARYLERFAWCFSRGFFVRKCFEALNSEQKPEHVGVRAALETLFAEYRRHPSSGVPEDVESYVEYCYADDMYMQLDVEATARFFTWLGVVRPEGRGGAAPAAAAPAPPAGDAGAAQAAGGWLHAASSWPCPACTYSNSDAHLQCYVCLTVRPEG